MSCKPSNISHSQVNTAVITCPGNEGNMCDDLIDNLIAIFMSVVIM